MEYEPDHVGSFHGKLFVGPDALKGEFKSHPMLMGTDESTLRDTMEYIEDSIRRGLLPSSYSVHSSLSLLPTGMIDTTDQNLVIKAFSHDFDNEGYRTGKPLRKDIFFTNPYLTCGECNHVAFLDAATLRNGLLFRQASLVPTKIDLILRSASTVSEDELHRAEIDGKNIAPVRVLSENFPACQICGRTDEYRIGLHDLADEIRERKQKERDRIARINHAALQIQLAYRRYCRKMYSQARWKRGLVRRLLHYKAATKIISYARGRLARRKAKCEIWLRVIKSAIPSLLRWALQPTPNDLKCFWYSRPKELELVFSDYWKLLERTGYNPPRLIVEMNICELGKRILERQTYLITVIQRRWRGFVARRFVGFYRVEIMRLLQKQIARVLKIQRVYRAHVVRGIFMPALHKQNRHDAIMSRYKQDRIDQKEIKRKHDRNVTLVAHYAHERQLEKTARLTSRIDRMVHYESRKMRAWANSIYFAGKAGGDRLTLLMDDVLADVQHDQQQEKDRIAAEQQRKAYIKDKVMHTGPVGYGLRSVNYLPPVADDAHAEGDVDDILNKALGGTKKKHGSKRKLSIPEGVDPLSEDYQPGGKYNVLREDLKKNRDPHYFIKVKKPPRRKTDAQGHGLGVYSHEEGSEEGQEGGQEGVASSITVDAVAGAEATPLASPPPAIAATPTPAVGSPVAGDTAPAAGAAVVGPTDDTATATHRTADTVDPPRTRRDIAAIFGAHASRSRGMGLMFEEELAEITASTIDRVAHDFRKKKGAHELLARLSDYNRRREVLFTDELKKLKYADGGGPGKGVSKAFSLGLVSLPSKDKSPPKRKDVDNTKATAVTGTSSGNSTALVVSSTIGTTATAAASVPPQSPVGKQRKHRTGDPKDRKHLQSDTTQATGEGGDASSDGLGHAKGMKTKTTRVRTMKPAGFKYPPMLNESPIDWLYGDNMQEFANSKTYSK